MHVIIAGAARSGKTSLALMLNKYGFTHYKMDSIKRGICEVYDIKYDRWEDVSPVVCKIINRVILDNNTDTNYGKEKYLFDTPFIFPKDINLIDTSDTEIIFLGYSKASPVEILKIIREKDNNNFWTNQKSDEELLKLIELDIDYSKKVEKECEKFGIKYYDTTYNRDQILNKIVEEIVNK